jgi:hypothetical protein
MRIVRNFCSARPTARAMSISRRYSKDIDPIASMLEVIGAAFWVHSMEVVTGQKLAQWLPYYAVMAVMAVMRADALPVRA